MLSNKINSELILNISRGCAICAATIGPFSSAVMSITCISMAVFWLASGQAFNLLKIAFSQSVAITLAFFLLILFIGSFYSSVDLKQSFITLWSWRKLVYIFILFGLFNCIYWKQRFVNFYIIGMSIALACSYLAWFEIIPSRKDFIGIIAGNYSQQSLSFVVAIVCCIVQLPQVTRKTKYIYLTLIIFFSINVLYVSESRTGYVGLAIGSLVALLQMFGKKKSPHIILGLFSILLIATMSSTILKTSVKEGFDELKSYQNTPVLTSIGTRVVYAKNTLEMISQKPILGFGTGSFGLIYQQHIANKYNDWRSTPTTDPHNQYLFILAENGILGLLFFLIFVVTTIRQGIKADHFGTIASSVLCAWVVCSLFNSQFKTFIEGHLLALFIGALLAPITIRPSSS